MPENFEGHPETAIGGSAVASGVGGSEEGIGAGDPTDQSAAREAGQEVSRTQGFGERVIPESDDDSGNAGEDESGSDPEEARSEVSTLAKRIAGAGKRIPLDDITRALKESDGNVELAAKVLQTTGKSIRRRIASSPELNAIYGGRGENDVVNPPTEMQTMLRSREDDPLIVLDETAAGVVRETEKLIHSGLEKVGVPRETIETLRSLHSVAVTGGEFLAQSVWDIQDLYSIELYKIPSRLEWIRSNYLEKEGISTMERMFWQRASNELLEIMGKGKDRMIAGAEAISAMLKGQSGEKPAIGIKKPGWGPRKSGG